MKTDFSINVNVSIGVTPEVVALVTSILTKLPTATVEAPASEQPAAKHPATQHRPRQHQSEAERLRHRPQKHPPMSQSRRQRKPQHPQGIAQRPRQVSNPQPKHPQGVRP